MVRYFGASSGPRESGDYPDLETAVQRFGKESVEMAVVRAVKLEDQRGRSHRRIHRRRPPP